MKPKLLDKADREELTTLFRLNINRIHEELAAAERALLALYTEAVVQA